MFDLSLLGDIVTTCTLVIFRRPPWFKRMFLCWAPTELGASPAAHKKHCTTTWSLFGVGMDQNTYRSLAVIPSSPCCRQVSSTDAHCPQAQGYAAGYAPKYCLGQNQVETALQFLGPGGSCFCSPRLGWWLGRSEVGWGAQEKLFFSGAVKRLVRLKCNSWFPGNSYL